MIQHRLLNWYGVDTHKNLGIDRVCGRPSDTLLIDTQGNCYACECQSWLPVPVGNLHQQNLQDIIEGETRQELQQSVSDGSYRYCNSNHCSYIKDNHIPKQNTEFSLRLAIDDSCNLSCPSCRKHSIFLQKGRMFEMRMNLAKKIVEFLSSQSGRCCLHIGSDGDPFASLIYRYILRHTGTLNNIDYTITTNGLLIDKMYQRVPDLFKRLKTLNISVDGASASTYELLRRGGQWKRIKNNLNFVKQIKSKHNFEFIIHMVVQRSNYKELGDMVELARNVGADRVWFNRITDWNVMKNFDLEDIANKSHPEHDLYTTELENLKKLKQENKNIVIKMTTL